MKQTESDEEENNPIIISIGGCIIDCSNSDFLLESAEIKNEDTSPFIIDMKVSGEELSLVRRFLQRKELNIDSKEKYKLFKELNHSLQLPYLSKKLHLFKQNKIISNTREFGILTEIYQILFFINDLEETINISKEIVSQTGSELFARTILYAILSNPYQTKDYIAILRHLPDHTSAFQYFVDCYKSEIQNSYIERNFKNEYLYIAHFLISTHLVSKEELSSRILNNQIPLIFVDTFDINPVSITRQSVKSNFFYENLSILSENGWELHKKLVNSGVNPNPIAMSIRDDDLDSLKSYYNNPYFDPNMILEKSIYERTTVSSKNLNLVEYAAFHNSQNCLQFLIQNGASEPSENSMFYKYLICGKCEILRRVRVSDYKNFLKYAVLYHNSDAISAIIDYEDDNNYSSDIIEIAKIMIQFCEFEGFFYLIQTIPFSYADLKKLLNIAEEFKNDLLAKIIQAIIRMN